MSRPTRIAIVGAEGRMGASLLENAAGLETVEIVGAVVRAGEAEGQSLGPMAVTATADIAAVATAADVVIDFSAPAACLEAARACAARGTAFVTGTTGLSADEQERLEEIAGAVALVQAANFSVGVNVMEHIVELASRATAGAFDLEVFEAHHRHKVDAPSGTALFLGRAAARGRDVGDLDDVATWARHGKTGPRKDDAIGFSVVRGGSIVGEHTVFLCGEGERIELTHRADDRGIFARGALRAALWVADQQPGLYSMRDVLF